MVSRNALVAIMLIVFYLFNIYLDRKNHIETEGPFSICDLLTSEHGN